MSTQTLPIDRVSLVEQSKARKEPEWMTSLREQALELAGTLDWPVLEKNKNRPLEFDFLRHL